MEKVCEGRNMGLYRQQIWVQEGPLTHISCVPLNNVYNLSGPPFSYLGAIHTACLSRHV